MFSLWYTRFIREPLRHTLHTLYKRTEYIHNAIERFCIKQSNFKYTCIYNIHIYLFVHFLCIFIRDIVKIPEKKNGTTHAELERSDGLLCKRRGALVSITKYLKLFLSFSSIVTFSQDLQLFFLLSYTVSKNISTLLSMFQLWNFRLLGIFVFIFFRSLIYSLSKWRVVGMPLKNLFLCSC